MAYELHIQGPRTAITLEQWKAAVSCTEAVRLLPDDHSAMNPETGEIITLPRREGDVEVFFPSEGIWRHAFRWGNGQASFRGSFPPGDLSNPIWRASMSLATRLGAIIRGDGGEIYDVSTGQVVDD